MIPWQSWHLRPWRQPPLPRNNQVSETRHHTFVLLYCFCCLRKFFLCRRLFFTIFLTSNVVATRALNAWLDHVFWCHYHLASTKKGVPSSPTKLIGSGASMLTTTRSSSTKALMVSSSLSLLIIKSAQQLLLGSSILSTKLPAYHINWLSIDNIRCELKK